MGYPIDYRCNDGRFQVSASLLSRPNPAGLSSSETQVNLGIRSQNKDIGGIYFTEIRLFMVV
jgi:hypothetical protein